MKKHSLIISAFIFAFLCSGVFAQDDYESTYDTESTYSSDETSTTETTPTYTATATTDASSSSSSSGDGKAPRTRVYNAVMKNNIAADFTVADYMVRPYLIGEEQFITATGDNGLVQGTFSVKAMGWNVFGTATNTSRPSALTVQRLKFGVANESFGGGLIYELQQDKVAIDAINPPDTETSTVYMSDAYGVFGAMGIGDLGAYFELVRVTGPYNEVAFDMNPDPPAPGADYEVNSDTTQIRLGCIKDTEGEGDHALGAELYIGLGSSEANAPAVPVIEESFMDIDLRLFHGVPLVQNDDFAVFAGASALIGFLSEEDNQANTEATEIDFELAPNISFRKILGKGFEAEVGVAMNMFNFNTRTVKQTVAGAGSSENKNRTVNTLMDTPYEVGAGLRWVTGNFTLEGQVNTPILTEGPNFISGTTTDLFMMAGLAIGW